METTGLPTLLEGRTRAALAALLVLAFLLRVLALDQPIVENYVGRQVPTAMVARNLERGSGFLNPVLDVAPFPNRFLVEPPVYAWLVVIVRRVSGLSLEASGRLVSAAGIVLGAWGLFGLARRREGDAVALASVAAFAVFPVTLRYGRAFQPDALMLGFLLAGLRAWDDFEAHGGLARIATALVLVATGLALKVISAYLLVPLALVIMRKRRTWPGNFALAAATLVPAALWYIHAARLMTAGGGSHASSDNGAVWLGVLVPWALARSETYRHIGRFLLVRAFTPLGPPLALAGMVVDRHGERLWLVWGASAMAAMVVMAAKLHHEYYWLAVAPVAAVGVGKALLAIDRHGVRGRILAGVLGFGLIALSAGFAASTWKTPPEWESLVESARQVRQTVPEGTWVVAPEALLFASDRAGCRLEFTPSAARRAAGEWGESPGGSGALALVEFYRGKGALYFADVRPSAIGAERLALHDAVRRRYKVVIDQPGVLIAELTENPKGAEHGPGQPDQADAP
jgi:4-amino-4-deoxy-L-arabinose transferase-like glycosyltransferase